MTYSSSWTASTGSTIRFTSNMMPLSTEPFLAGTGPVECSSSRALSVRPAFIYDVNGYYRDLGVSPTATRKEMRLAYYERDGQSSERLTYCLKQLLNAEIRAEYDALPLGTLLFDRYIEEAIARRAKIRQSDEMARRHADGLVVNEEIEREALREAFKAEGVEINFSDDTPEGAIDPDPSGGQDDVRPAKIFGYAFYLWRTRLQGDDDLQRLAMWQEHIVRALSTRGVQIRIAVGLLGGMASRATWARVGYREVFFLHHLETPTADLANWIADEWIKYNPSQRKILL